MLIGETVYLTAVTHIPRPLRVFFWFSFSLTAASILSVYWRWTHGDHRALDSLFMPDTGFDYDDYAGRYLYVHSAQFFALPGYPWYYPAPAIFVLSPFYALAHSPWEGYSAFLIASGLICLAMAGFLGRALSTSGMGSLSAYFFGLTALLLSWPIYFAMQRGNIEVLIWPWLVLAVWLWWHERYTLAAILLGLAGSVKIYPLLFLMLFAKRRDWSSVAVSLGVFTTVTIAALWFLDPHLSQSFTFVRHGVTQWTKDYSEVNRGGDMDHSLFGLFKTLYRHRAYHRALQWYYLTSGSLFAAWLVRSKLPKLNFLAILTLASVTLPSTSFDYTLGALYIPFGMLAVSSVKVKEKGQAVGMALFAAALSPLAFLSYKGIGLGGPTRAVVLVLMSLWWFRYKSVANNASSVSAHLTSVHSSS